MALADKYYTIGVLGKSFGVIELMAHQAKWELRDLAKPLASPRDAATYFADLRTRFVSQDGKGGAYSLTLKFFKLGQRIASNNSLVEKARPLAASLWKSKTKPLTCVAQNFDMVVMAQQVSWQILRLDSIIGSSFPIYPRRRARSIALFWKRANC